MPDPSSSTDDISDGAPAGSFCGRSSQDTLRWRRPFHMLEDRGTNAAPAAPAVARGWTPDSGLPVRSPSSERRGMAAEGSPPPDDDAASACLACMAILSTDSERSLRAPPNPWRCIPRKGPPCRGSPQVSRRFRADQLPTQNMNLRELAYPDFGVGTRRHHLYQKSHVGCLRTNCSTGPMTRPMTRHGRHERAAGRPSVAPRRRARAWRGWPLHACRFGTCAVGSHWCVCQLP